MQPKNKREPTLKELMMMQGKIPPNGQTVVRKPETVKTPSLKQQMDKPPQPAEPPKTKWQETREGRIKTMIEEDPEKAAELLRKVFLNGKQG